MNQSCSLCKKNTEPLVPKVWCESESLCPPCFGIQYEKSEILTFDSTRGGLLSRWAAEGFQDHVMEDKERLYVLASQLDEHHLALLSNIKDIQLLLVEDYRKSGAIYQMTIKDFYQEMCGFY